MLLGISGGLVPSPSAFLLLVTGLFTGRSAFALLLVAVFGLGLGVVLVGVGLLALAGNDVVARGARTHHLVAQVARLAPVLAAGCITALGCAITSWSVMGLVGAG